MPEGKRALPQPTTPISDEGYEGGEGTLRRRALKSYQRHVLDNHDRMRLLREDGYRLQDFTSPVAGQLEKGGQAIFEMLGIPVDGVNETWPAVAAATGTEQTSRFQSKFTGRDPEDSKFADAVNATHRLIRDQGNFDHIDSKAFQLAAIQRVSAVKIYADLWSERTPSICCERIPLTELMIDFYCTKVNLEDRTAFSHGRWINWAEFRRLYYSESDMWLKLVEQQEGASADFESGDVWMASLGLDGRNSSFYRRRQREVFVVDHEWVEREDRIELDMPGEAAVLWQQISGSELPATLPDDPEFWKVVAQAVAQAQALNQQATQAQVQAAEQPSAEEAPPPPMPPIYRVVTTKQLLRFNTAWIELTGQPYTEYHRLKPEVVYHAVIVGSYVLRVSQTRDGGWSLIPLIPFFDDTPEVARPYSFVDLIRPRQLWLNQFVALWMHALAHMSKAQLGVDTAGDITQDDIDQMNIQSARGDAVIGLKGGKDAIFPWPKGQMPDGVQEAWQLMFDLVPGAAGQSRYSIGSVSDLQRTAAKLVNQQIEATGKTLAEMYASFGEFRKTVARKTMSLFYALASPDQFANLAGDFAEAIPFDRSLWLGHQRMNVKVGEEPSSKDMSLAAIEALNTTASWQFWNEISPKAIAGAMAPVLGSAFYDEAIEALERREPQNLITAAAEMFDVDAGELQAFLEGGGQQQQEVAQSA